MDVSTSSFVMFESAWSSTKYGPRVTLVDEAHEDDELLELLELLAALHPVRTA
jgi:hypothetical protein